MSVTRKDIGKRVTDGERTGVLRDVDLKWMDPSSPTHARRFLPQAWVKFDGQGERQLHPSAIERV
ncbi:hypothetical protein [Streptomyces sp. NBC_00385]|uniref:hypothetical protein n=1 Tax=Streptomyces sp. NBC_00385 TaxID=2975733 RepID=UPI002DDACF56|nr:hypothetical protein [Streptomyces sp. NBC_00385]WRZ05563.1 hypothetical protein OG959_20575 [Streptomyces sp. NBC_00385]